VNEKNLKEAIDRYNQHYLDEAIDRYSQHYLDEDEKPLTMIDMMNVIKHIHEKFPNAIHRVETFQYYEYWDDSNCNTVLLSGKNSNFSEFKDDL
jgi:uncharacterized protein YbgA (DUF1722 family)